MNVPPDPHPVTTQGNPHTHELDITRLRREFPLLSSRVHGKPLVYLDNGATSQKPRAVIEAVRRFYESENANIHRGVYALSQRATDAFEQARRTVQGFLNAASAREIIFTRGATESINLVATAYGGSQLGPGDEIVISAMEHHANIVPWQMLCGATGAVLKVIPVDEAGELRLDEYARLLGPRTRIVAVTQLSNALGTINDVVRITRMAKAVGAVVLIDGAQWVAHGPTDVRAIDCDFYVFSGHKVFAPTGIGVLYGRASLLEAMPPYQGGGDMIESVTFEKTTYADLPNKFEAGTPHIAGAIGLGVALEYLAGIGFERTMPHEHQLLQYAHQRLREVPGLRVIGNAANKGAVVSFVLEDPPISTYEAGVVLDGEGIAIRTGHHCCMPLMDRFRIAGTARASFAFYNTREDVDALADALLKLVANAQRDGRGQRDQRAPDDRARVDYPQPGGATVREAAAALVEDFALLDEREARDQYLLELGASLPSMPDALRTDTNRVRGCMSTVHLHARARPATADAIDFIADSDAPLVRGIIALLQRVFSGQSAREILEFDTAALLLDLGLDRHLTMSRRNGLEGMLKRIRAEAARRVAGS
ncbi:MAG: SufS family cysteine desulfurase [Thiotrichales bacterium]